MKETQKADVRPYLHAIYDKNRLRFAATLCLYLLFGLIDTTYAVLQGEVLNAITMGSLSRLALIAGDSSGGLVFDFLFELTAYHLKCRFVHQGIAQYKSHLFRQISRKAIAAFTRKTPGGICPC